MWCLEQTNFILQCNIAASIRNCLDHLMLASCWEDLVERCFAHTLQNICHGDHCHQDILIWASVSSVQKIGRKHTYCSSNPLSVLWSYQCISKEISAKVSNSMYCCFLVNHKHTTTTLCYWCIYYLLNIWFVLPKVTIVLAHEKILSLIVFMCISEIKPWR